MTLSIIIVNFNVKYFLEQCLFSVMNALNGIEAEIFVVDNNSVDGSCAMVRTKFPSVRLIENKKNTGFSFANNQAIHLAKGKYILLQNPDTVVQEDSYKKIINFMDSTPKAGGLGVKMINGTGDFLPESKRALPTPVVAFYKIFGFSSLFPKSRIFSKYHLGYLDNNTIHEVEILSGAFMLLRAEALKKTGYLDEDFFMYGEDIDLSYRIIKAGYQNFYFPETTIIHYKGESTKKSSINYVLVFYNAMIIFAKKHFSKQNAGIFSFLIKMAVYFRALIAIFHRFSEKILLPLFDSLLVYTGFHFACFLWEKYAFHQFNYYPPLYLNWVVPSYIFIWILSIYYSGGYDKPIKLNKLIKGIAVGSISILLGYSMLNEQLRFSRAQILFGSLWTILVCYFYRIFLSKLKILGIKLDKGTKKRLAIVGHEEEAKRISKIIKVTGIQAEIIGFIRPQQKHIYGNFIGDTSQLLEIVKINKINELVFCAKDFSNQEIIESMLELSSDEIEFKIAAPDSISIIGSNSIDTAGDIYSININSITKLDNKRIKRLFDFLSSFLLLCLSPFLCIFYRKPFNFIANCFFVLLSTKTWIGYCNLDEKSVENLPKLKPSVLHVCSSKQENNISTEMAHKLNLQYAKEYTFMKDIELLIKCLKKIDA